MGRLTYWNDDLGCWSYRCASGDAEKRLAAYENTLFKPKDIKDMHNELCLKCGNYKNAHLGACNGCRWKKEEN